MDSLDILPIEIWTEIILLAAPFVNIPPDPLTHLNFLCKSTYEPNRARIMQGNRLNLLCVCRSFYWVVEPLLYKEVILSGEGKAQCFRNNAITKRFGDQSCLEITKSLFIYQEALSTIVDQTPIQDLLPNLVTMVAYEQKNRLFWMWEIINGSRTLTHTTMYPIKNQSTHPSSALRRCSLVHFIRNEATHPIYTNIYAVSMSRSAIRNFRDLALPSLRQLFLEVGSVRFRENIRAFIEKNGSELVELEYAKAPNWPITVSFPQRLFEICHRLTKLRFNARSVRPCFPSTMDEVGIPHHSLTNLVMFVKASDGLSYIEGHSNWFTLARFPRLSQVTLLLEDYENTEVNSFHSSVSLLFPNVDILIIN